MIIAGTITSTVRVELSLRAGDDPFWSFMGIPIFVTGMMFAVFYCCAMASRRRPEAHKRWIVLASAAALGAATFRIGIAIAGPGPLCAILGTLSCQVFVVAGMIHDYRSRRRVHPVFLGGFVASVALFGGSFIIVASPAHEAGMEAIAWIGRLFEPLYWT